MSFFKKKWVKVVLIILVFFIFLWFLLGFFSPEVLLYFLKINFQEEHCDDDCQHNYILLAYTFADVAQNHPRLKTKFKQAIFDSKQPIKFRKQAFSLYGLIYGLDENDYEKIAEVLKNPQTPKELKQFFLSALYGSTESFYGHPESEKQFFPTSPAIFEEIYRIIQNENEDNRIRATALSQLGRSEDEKHIPFVLSVFKQTKNQTIKYEIAKTFWSLIGDKPLTNELVNEIKTIIYDENIHPVIREYFLNIIADSSDKNFAKEFLTQVYQNEKMNKFIRNEAVYLLDYFQTGKYKGYEKDYKYPFPLISILEEEKKQYYATYPDKY